MQIWIAIIVTIAFLLWTWVPLWSADSGQVLDACQRLDEPEALRELQAQIVRRYLDFEQDHAQGRISQVAWSKKQQFLANAYVDAAHRLDVVVATGSGDESPVSSSVAGASLC